MHRLRRRAFLAIAGAGLATPALADPERPLRMVLGGPPGGLNDIEARVRERRSWAKVVRATGAFLE
jgi:tripartite-type tricarboxylate transporter receptor subunit TctC